MIDEKQIKEWAEDPKAAISRDWQEWSAERRKLAQHIIAGTNRETDLSVALSEAYEKAFLRARVRSEKAERERDEMEQRARAYQAGASNLQEKRDALAAALANLSRLADSRPVTAEEINIILDAHAPGWRER